MRALWPMASVAEWPEFDNGFWRDSTSATICRSGHAGRILGRGARAFRWRCSEILGVAAVVWTMISLPAIAARARRAGGRQFGLRAHRPAAQSKE